MKPGDNIWNFTKEHLTGEGGGAGLGLAFVATVAERHGGEIQVEGVVGQGSTFMLRLPANNEESSVQSVSRLTHIDGQEDSPLVYGLGNVTSSAVTATNAASRLATKRASGLASDHIANTPPGTRCLAIVLSASGP